MSTLWLQQKYAGLLGHRFERFSIKNNSPFLATARCPFCGDSQKSKTKARFYIYSKEENLNCFCHNCGYAKSFQRFLKEFDEVIYRQFITERIMEDSPKEYIKPTPKKKISPNDAWKKFVIPASNHPGAFDVLRKRKIPQEKWDRLYYTDNFYGFYLDSCKALNVEVDETKSLPSKGGIVFPSISKDGVLVQLSWRNLDASSSLRYVNIQINEGYKIFGLDRVDEDEKIFVTEGQFDSLFLKNAVATGDASLERAAMALPKDKLILVPDNEKRAPVQVGRIQKMINLGFSVVLFPDYIKEKDLNDMHLAGHDVENLVSLNTFTNLQAKLAFKTWKKI